MLLDGDWKEERSKQGEKGALQKVKENYLHSFPLECTVPKGLVRLCSDVTR